MTAVRAVYDGKVFIPENPCEITKGSKVTLTIKAINSGFSENQKKLAAFRQLTKKVVESNKTDPLPPEFDEILSQRLQQYENGYGDYTKEKYQQPDMTVDEIDIMLKNQ